MRHWLGHRKQCRVCHCGFGPSVWKYKSTDCAHYFCSSHCKDLWLRADDVDEDEEDPFTVLKDEEAPVDASELPFPHGDGASVVSSVAPSAAGSSSGSKSSTQLLCIECNAPRRMALLRAELYHTLDDLEELRRVEVLTVVCGHHARRRVFWRQRGVNRGGAAA